MTNEQVINFEPLSIEEVKKDYHVLFETYQYEFPNSTEREIAIMVSIAVGTCPHCHESNRYCQCWNDD